MSDQAYCYFGDGRPATKSILAGAARDGTPIHALVCADCEQKFRASTIPHLKVEVAST